MLSTLPQFFCFKLFVGRTFRHGSVKTKGGDGGLTLFRLLRGVYVSRTIEQVDRLEILAK